MSELKAFDVGLGQYCEEGSPCIVAFDADRNPRLLNEKVYLKSEADKVIAELEEKHKTEVKELLCLIRDKENNFNRAFDSVEKELRHQKYKRCVAMAERCNDKIDNPVQRDEHDDWLIITEYWERWHERWLALAEKFMDKEAK